MVRIMVLSPFCLIEPAQYTYWKRVMKEENNIISAHTAKGCTVFSGLDESVSMIRLGDNIRSLKEMFGHLKDAYERLAIITGGSRAL